MYWRMREEFKIAYSKAAEVLSKIDVQFGEAIKISDVVKAVESLTNTEVRIMEFDFEKLNSADKPERFSRYGAAMCVSEENGKRVARVLLNSRETIEMQRFSLVHELGHLVVGNMEDCGAYLFSTHIDMDITSISKEELDADPSLVNEQVANIFALLVLLPYNAFLKAMKKCNSIDEIAKMFGVERDAIVSRILLKSENSYNG